MAEIQDWSSMRGMMERLLKERTGEDLAVWNERVRQLQPTSENTLRIWLKEQGVTGYAQSLLVMETFGYPAYLTTAADELINAQYADRPQLRPIFDAIIGTASGLGVVTVQARKTYVFRLTPKPIVNKQIPKGFPRIINSLRLEKPKAD